MADRTTLHRESGRKRNSRSVSPRRHSHSHRARSKSPHRHHKKRKVESITAVALPYNSRPLTKHDFVQYMPMFGRYLDIQKNKTLADLSDTEVKGRWKSFTGKWNRGELSNGWYDPSTFQNALATPAETPMISSSKHRTDTQTHPAQDGSSDSDDSVGPVLPGQERLIKTSRIGPSIPSMQDLELKREMDVDDRLANRDNIKFERKLERKSQKDALDELIPRAATGTRERQLEKKKEVNEKMKSFREKSPGAAEVPDNELMGGGDGVGEFKKIKENYERKKNERELRRDEFLRARQVDREERLSEYKAKEEKTMDFLKQLAKQNFG